jgi:CheY-like chemotaxis protein
MSKRKLVLLIDDDSDDRELFCEAVGVINGEMDCKTIGDSTEALSILKSTKRLPDYIFLDLNMPVLNGKQVLAELKQNEKLKEIPVIIYTTSLLDDDVRETQSLGASFFIQKPSLFNEICEILSSVLKKLENH